MDGMETKPRIHGTYVICVCVWSCLDFIVYLTGKRHTKLEYQYLCPRTPFDPFNSFDLVILGSRGGTWCCVGDKMFFCSHALPLAIAEDEEKRHTAVRETTLFFFFCRQLSCFKRAFNNFFPDRCFSIPQGSDVRSTAGIELAISEHDISGPLSFLRDKNKEMSKFTTSTKKSSSKCHPGDTARHLINCLLDSFGHNH